MKKPRKKPSEKRHEPQSNTVAATAKAKAASRRSFLRNAAIALPVFAATGFFSVRYVQAKVNEADLTRIGQGTPTVVQIHDPQCVLCRTLQRQTRSALKAFEKDAVTFLVANIKTDDGRVLAAKYNVPHVTLLLFDAKGEMMQIVRGPSDTDSLRTILEAHVMKYGS
ncbi:MAG: thioredoxin-like negative regulator of GroEL [Pseudorhodobacter sp.]|jgi:thioredoxin-like negative regulator of GroEL